MEIDKQFIVVTSNNTYKNISENNEEIVVINNFRKGLLTGNDWQIVPKFTTYSINTSDIPKAIKDRIDNMGIALWQQLNANDLRLSDIEEGKATELVFIKDAQASLAYEIEALKATTGDALAGIVEEKMSYAEAGKAISSARQAIISEIAGEYITRAYIVNSVYTKAESNAAIAIAEELLSVQIDDMDAKYDQILSVTISPDGTVKSQKVEELEANISNNSSSISTLQEVTTTHTTSIAKSSQYVTAMVGGKEVVTGWTTEARIESGKAPISAMTISADNFTIKTDQGGLTPFEIHKKRS